MSRTSDQSFVNIRTVVIGALVLLAGAIGVVAYVMSNRTNEVSQTDDPALRAALIERIAPIGSVLVAGEEAASTQPVTAPAPAPAPAATVDARSGEEVYNLACVACHTAGIAGSPRLGDAEAWAPRIALGLALLSDHAINGYTGETGIMPAKGGNVSLSDDEVVAATEYMISQSQ